MNDTYGEIQAMDRNKDGRYDHKLNCHWKVVCGVNQVAELRLVSMILERVEYCEFYDYLEVCMDQSFK